MSPTPTHVAPRRIAHLDMDAFYASVELLRFPELIGRPVAIGGRGDPTRRGVVTTASYEARVFGVHSGMALSVAARRCPECIFLPTDFEHYRRVSHQFKTALRNLVPRIEDRGIDEVYLDLTGLPGTARSIAESLQNAVREACGLSCAVGVAANKLIAKIASDLDKPGGITVIPPARVPTRIWPLPLRRMPGIGPAAEARLLQAGYLTLGDLACADPERLIGQFGQRMGHWLHRSAHGLDDRPLDLDPAPRSFSRETTFQRDLRPQVDSAALQAHLQALAESVSHDLVRRGYRARTLGIKLRDADFKTLTRERSLPQAVNDAPRIAAVARGCLERVSLVRPIRLLGVRAAGLEPVEAGAGSSDRRSPESAQTLTLFD